MNDKVVFHYLLVLAIGCHTYSVQGFECNIAKVPINIIGADTYSVHFNWSCTLMSNETVVSVEWFKEDIRIAMVWNNTFESSEGYSGRVDPYESYGISIYNITRNDSGHYTVVVLLNGSLQPCIPCQPIYLPALPEKSTGFNNGAVLQCAISEHISQSDRERLTNLETGLISGIVVLSVAAVITVIGVVLWSFRRTKQNANHNEDCSSKRYLMYPLPVIGGLGLISTIVYCLRKKYTSRSRVTQVSMNPMNERPREGENNQDQTLHYWTIDPNAINSLRTSVHSDVDVELRQIFDSTTKNTVSQTCEEQASSNSGYIEVVSTFSDSFQLDGYINPINYDITQVNGTTSPRESSSIDCNEYLNPVHSNICEIKLDPIDPNYKEACGSVDSHILSHSGDQDRDSVSACSNALECDENLDQLPKPPRRN